jgi:hypothetical protein
MKKILVIFFISFSLNFFSSGREFEKLHEFIDDTVLLSDRVQIFEYKAQEGKTYRVGAIRIDASTDIVWEILEDMEMLGAKMPYIEYQKITYGELILENKRKGNIIVEGRLSIPNFSAQYTLTMDFNRLGMWRKWRILTPKEVASYNSKGVGVLKSSGLIREMEGFEYIEPYDKKTGTIYYYALNLKSTIPLPEFIMNTIENALFEQHMALIKEMAESLPGEKE